MMEKSDSGRTSETTGTTTEMGKNSAGETLATPSDKHAKEALNNKACPIKRALGFKRFSECGKAKTMAKMIEVVRTQVTEEQFAFMVEEMKREFPNVESKMKHLMCLANQIDPSLAARCVTALKSKCGMPICRKRKTNNQKPTTNVEKNTPLPRTRGESASSCYSTADSEMSKQPIAHSKESKINPSTCIQSMFSRYRNGRPVGSLTMAARLGNAPMVQSFLKESMENDEKMNRLRCLVDRCGNSALHCAAQGGNAEVVRTLISNGWNVNARTIAGKTPLIVACRKGCLEVIETFINHGADVNASDKCDCTALLVALRSGQNKIVQLLIHAGADMNQSVLHTGMTPLMVAAVAGNVEGIELLLRNGASRTLKSKAGFTALLLAAKAGKLDAVIALFQGPVSISETCNQGFNALHLASQNGHTELVVRLVQFGFKVDSLGGSLVAGSTDDACPNSPFSHPMPMNCGAESETEERAPKQRRHMLVADTTPLMLACEFGRTDTAVVLLNMGADPLKRNSCGLSSVALADINGHVNTVRALRMAGHGHMRSRGDSQSSSCRKRCGFKVPCSPASSVATANENSYRSDVGGNTTTRDSDVGEVANRGWMSD